MGDEIADDAPAPAGEATSSLGEAEDRLRRAHVGLLAVDELGVDEQAVLEAVDAGGGGVAEADRAEVAGDLEAVACAAAMAASSCARGDDVVDLERRHAFGGPVVDQAA